MKVCEICGQEMVGAEETDIVCSRCDAEKQRIEKQMARRRAANQRRKEKEEILKSMGLVKVKGALGGTYWE